MKGYRRRLRGVPSSTWSHRPECDRRCECPALPESLNNFRASINAAAADELRRDGLGGFDTQNPDLSPRTARCHPDSTATSPTHPMPASSAPTASPPGGGCQSKAEMSQPSRWFRPVNCRTSSRSPTSRSTRRSHPHRRPGQAEAVPGDHYTPACAWSTCRCRSHSRTQHGVAGSSRPSKLVPGRLASRRLSTAAVMTSRAFTSQQTRRPRLNDATRRPQLGHAVELLIRPHRSRRGRKYPAGIANLFRRRLSALRPQYIASRLNQPTISLAHWQQVACST